MDVGPQVDYDGHLSDAYEQGRQLSREAERTWQAAVAPHVRSADLVVDVGAGTGRFGRRLARLGATRTIALEPARGMRDASRRVDPGSPPSPQWVAGHAEALPLRSRSADVVWVAFVVHYLDLGRCGAEFARVLAPGGRLLVWSQFPDRFDDVEWLRWFPSARAIDESRMPSVERLQESWRPAGLRLRSRTLHPMLVAPDLSDLADRVAHRAISTLALISDSEFHDGLAALRDAASRRPPAPVRAPNDLLVFTR